MAHKYIKRCTLLTSYLLKEIILLEQYLVKEKDLNYDT